jgi:hypothetical protein
MGMKPYIRGRGELRCSGRVSSSCFTSSKSANSKLLSNVYHWLVYLTFIKSGIFYAKCYKYSCSFLIFPYDKRKIFLFDMGCFFFLYFSFYCSQRRLNYLAFKSLDCGRPWWMLCQNSFVLIKLDDLRMYYRSMTCYIFNWSLNLYAQIFQDYLKYTIV